MGILSDVNASCDLSKEFLRKVKHQKKPVLDIIAVRDAAIQDIPFACVKGIFFIFNLLDDRSVKNVHQLIGSVLVHLAIVFGSEVDYFAVLDVGVENAFFNGLLKEHGQVCIVLQVRVFARLHWIFKRLEHFFGIFIHMCFLQ